MKKVETRNILYNLNVTGVLLAAFSLIIKQLFEYKEVSIILWILSITFIIPYLIYKQWKQENWTSKDLWPNALLTLVCIIYLFINNKT